jgi:hypothetical protein
MAISKKRLLVAPAGCPALNQHHRRISDAHSILYREGNLHRTDEVHPLRVAANTPDALLSG